MKANRRKKLEAAGWKVGTAKEFLKLSAEEAAFVELKLAKIIGYAYKVHKALDTGFLTGS